MKLIDNDIEFLKNCFPSLTYEPKAQKIIGELSFCACYDKTIRKVRIETSEPDDVIRKSDSFLCDVFEIEISLDSESIESNGWPEVHEIGGRHKSIAKKYGVEIIDLHFFPDSACCLGIRYSRERNLTIERFLLNLVVPFFYRLSYTDQFGIEAARNNLWDEYSHGDKGRKEHARELFSLARRNRGRNKPCPCGSNIKYKKCCLDEVEAVKKRQKRHIVRPRRGR